MATPKTWTATNVKMGTLQLSLVDTTLSAVQGYSFIGSDGEVVEQLPKRTVTMKIEFAELPAEIRQALSDLNAFMHARALLREGME